MISEPFGNLSDGSPVTVFHLRNSKGASMDVIDYGCRVVSIRMPDRNGCFDDVVVGPGDIESFENGPERFFGSVIGRYGNRINHSAFVIDGTRFEVVANESLDGEPVCCHGGPLGFDRMKWEGRPVSEPGRCGVRFHRISPDGEQGFPGALDAYVTYWLTNDNVIRMEYEASTDKPTVVNLSNHTYFNLHGSAGSYVMEHLFTVEADTTVLNNRQMCPDKLIPVEDTPFDFREPHTVDYRLDMPNEQLRIMKGMSACWKIRGYDGNLRRAADLYDQRSGRGVETWTTEPALLTFTGRTFDPSVHIGKYGPIQKYGGMLLETIHFADSPNQDRFPSTVLRPGERYYSTTEYKFYAK
ncbi:MAG: galactose mutarotase [Bacteroidales bacterium]|nr:galactose mutarotase [Bacteroidales bacterium]